MTLPRLAILLLRGLEGCGVTSYARHLQAYFKSQESDCDIFVLTGTKKVGRPDTSRDIVYTGFAFEESEEIVESLNANYDLVMVFSVPAKKAGDEVAEQYVARILEPITVRKAFINHDHSVNSISRNADYIAALRACDVTLAHSLAPARRGFINWLERKEVTDITVDKLDTFFHVPLVEDLISLSKDGRSKKIIAAGRHAVWKRTWLTWMLHEYARDRGFITETIGVVRDISGYEYILAFKDRFNFHPATADNAKKTAAVFEEWDKNPDPMTFYWAGSYEYYVGLDRISKSAFATQHRSFEHNGLDYGSNMEYQTMEAALLSIGVLHRHFLDTAIVPGTTTLLRDTGAFVSIDDDNIPTRFGYGLVEPEKLIEELDDIWNNRYAEMRQKSVSLIREFYSTEALVPLMIERCLG